MQKKISFRRKIDLLLASLEALTIHYRYYIFEGVKDIENRYGTSNCNLINFIELNKNFRSYCNNRAHKLITIIVYIYIISRTLDQFLFKKIAKSIITCYSDSSKSIALKIYISKFSYIYFYKNEYYKQYKSIQHIDKTNINQTAIINLYLISKITERQGIYYLLKHLYN